MAKVVVVSLLLLMLLSQAVSGQKVSKRQGWEYCAVTNSGFTRFASAGDTVSTGFATICYFQSTGCRKEEVKFDLDLSEFRKSLNAGDSPAYILSAAPAKAAEGALEKAITRLGDDGWEMVGQAPLSFGNESTPAIYFKRRK
jgi:hypothetical protein